MSDILTGTPPELTYLHPLVREAWAVVWAIVSGALVVILGWLGLNLIVGEHLGRPQAGWREIVPRLVLGLVAATTSLWWCALVIDVAGAVSGFIAVSLDVTPGDLVRAPLGTLLAAVETGSVGMAIVLALLYLVYGFFVLYVVVQMILRLAMLDVLLALAPVALGLWILPHTAGWGRHWLRLFMITAFQQSVQLIALALAFGFLNEYAAFVELEPVRDAVWKLLMSVAFIYLATKVPSMLGATGRLRLLAAHPLFRDVAARIDAPRRRFHGPPVGRSDRRRSGWSSGDSCRRGRCGCSRRHCDGRRGPAHRRGAVGRRHRHSLKRGIERWSSEERWRVAVARRQANGPRRKGAKEMCR